MIIEIPEGETRYYTAPPLSEVPIKIQVLSSTGWSDYGSIKYCGHVVPLYGPAEYRFSIASRGPACCMVYTPADVVLANPKIYVKPTIATSSKAAN